MLQINLLNTKVLILLSLGTACIIDTTDDYSMSSKPDRYYPLCLPLITKVTSIHNLQMLLLNAILSLPTLYNYQGA